MTTANGVSDGPGAPEAPSAPPSEQPGALPRPNVYLPQAPEVPAYDEYGDPAAAHGWQNAYDETSELPLAVPDDDTAPLPVVPGPRTAPPGELSGGGPGRAAVRKARKKRRATRSRKAAVAAGAVGAVSLAAVIAGFSLSGASSGGGRQKDGTGTSTGDTVPPGEEASSADASVTGSPKDAAPSATASPSAGSASGRASASASADGGADGSGSGTAAGSSTAPTPTASASSPVYTGPGNSGRGHGKGNGGSR